MILSYIVKIYNTYFIYKLINDIVNIGIFNC